jgi:hypothetical protein
LVLLDSGGQPASEPIEVNPRSTVSIVGSTDASPFSDSVASFDGRIAVVSGEPGPPVLLGFHLFEDQPIGVTRMAVLSAGRLRADGDGFFVPVRDQEGWRLVRFTPDGSFRGSEPRLPGRSEVVWADGTYGVAFLRDLGDETSAVAFNRLGYRD